jgi:hypothetical protein
LCVLWTALMVALMVMVFFIGGEGQEGDLGITACLAILPWIIGFVVPFIWRYIVYGSPRKRYHYY